MSVAVGEKTIARAAWVVPWLLIALTGTGCARVGHVSGKVSYHRQPLPDGTVMLMASDGRPYDGKIQPDGSFTIQSVPAGLAKVSITSIDPAGDAKTAGGGPDASRAKRRADVKGDARSRIPFKYSDFDRSGLTVTVENGATATLELDLK